RAPARLHLHPRADRPAAPTDDATTRNLAAIPDVLRPLFVPPLLSHGPFLPCIPIRSVRPRCCGGRQCGRAKCAVGRAVPLSGYAVHGKAQLRTLELHARIRRQEPASSIPPSAALGGLLLSNLLSLANVGKRDSGQVSTH